MIVETEALVLFWKDSWPSQWYMCDFVVGTVEFCCAEQYMMAEKAILFNDNATYTKIMSTRNPEAIKKLGRSVQNFNESVWEKHREEIVTRGNVAKFSVPRLRNLLLATKDKLIAEASPYDTVWGIGFAPNDVRAQDPQKWRGMNLLGKCLMNVRRQLSE